ncbi:MAG: hypothetical protein ACK5PF_03705, partial [bacterium]
MASGSVGFDLPAPEGDAKRPASREAKFAAVVQSGLARAASDAATNSDERAVARAESVIRAGGKHSLHYAVKGLVNTSYGSTAVTERLCQEAERLHPPPSRPVEEVPQEVRDDWATHVVDEKTVRNVVLGWVCNGSAPGPSGWTGEMLRTVVLDDEGITGLTGLCNALLSGMGEPCVEA